MKEIINVIFIAVVYKNVDDLRKFLSDLNINYSYKVVIVDNYYSDEISSDIKKIASDFACDYIPNDNTGYGAGNNVGINYASKCYEFQYLVVCNTDILINKFNLDEFNYNDCCVIAPMIENKNGKLQNPYWAKKKKFSEFLMYKGCKRKNIFLLYLGILNFKISRYLFMLFFSLSKKTKKNVYASHGSFVIFTKKTIDIIKKPYDEKMFLFAEEAYLAHYLEGFNINTYITKNVSVLHFEDGTMSVSSINESKELRKSIIYYYEKIVKRKVNKK